MTTYTLRQKVKNFAIASRFIVLGLSAISNLVIPDHDADAFVSPIDSEVELKWGDTVVDYALGGLKRWDAQYFMHIAQYGYSHENTLAFFPLYPLIVRYAGYILHVPLQFFCSEHNTLLIAAVLINFFLFIKTAVVFYCLSLYVLRDEFMAYRSALLFCINPASIFFTAPYSECLYAFLTIYAFYYNEGRGATHASLPFALATSTRANGLVNIGFILYRKLQDCSTYFYKIRNANTCFRIRNAKIESGHLNLVIVLVLTFNSTFLPLFMGVLTLVMPFAIFQIWAYYRYCSDEGLKGPRLSPHLEMYVRSNFLHSPDLGEAEWCYNYPPIAYSHVQDKYWEVGLLRYYEVRQVPNFLLALPIVMLVICHCALYLVDNPSIVWSLGIPPNVENQDKKKDDTPTIRWNDRGINSWRVFVYTSQSLVLCIFCALCIHVQVTTRLLCSSCPVVYWFAAHLMKDHPSSGDHSSDTSKSKPIPAAKVESLSNLRKFFNVSILTEFPKNFWGQVIISYFLLYFFVGNVLFSNFLPWT